MLDFFKRKKNKKNKKTRDFYAIDNGCQIPYLGTYYRSYFGERSDGVFVEIGAFDGDTISNTSVLADLGWQGFYVEPVPQYYELCKARNASNRNIEVDCLAIGAEEKKVTIFVGDMLSTSRSDHRDALAEVDWAKGSFVGGAIEARQVTLESYLSSKAISPGFELLSIDVEGGEWDVLRGWDIKKWAPRMVIVELPDEHPDFLRFSPEYSLIKDYFSRNDYRLIFKDLINSVYVRDFKYSEDK